MSGLVVGWFLECGCFTQACAASGERENVFKENKQVLSLCLIPFPWGHQGTASHFHWSPFSLVFVVLRRSFLSPEGSFPQAIPSLVSLVMPFSSGNSQLSNLCGFMMDLQFLWASSVFTVVRPDQLIQVWIYLQPEFVRLLNPTIPGSWDLLVPTRA